MAVDPRAFLESSPLVPIALSPATSRVAFVGPQARGHLGHPLEKWMEPGFWSETLFPDDQATVARARAATAAGRVHTIDYRMEHADGRVIWTSEVLSLAVDPDGRPQLQGFLIDVTDRKRQEVALWKSEERLRAMLRGAPDAMVLTSADGIILDMNDQAESLADYRLAEIAGSSIDHLLPERLRDRLADLRAAFERDPRRRSLVDGHSLVIERSDGTEIPVELSMSLVRAGSEPHQILCSVRDLTARRRVEAQLRSSERRLREMADVVPAMVCFIDTDSRYRFVNDAYATWLGWERQHLEGRRVREVLGESRFAHLSPSLEAALGGSASRSRSHVSNGSGAELPVNLSVVPQHDEDGDVSGCFVVMLDVSEGVAALEADERHRAELAHVARVVTMGDLAASIANELTQPLTAIVANAQAAYRLLCAEKPDLALATSALVDITADGRRASDVIASMRQLLQRGDAREEPIDLHALVHDVADLLRSEAIGRGVAIVTEGSARALPPVHGDLLQIKQLLINLLVNAIEAAASVASGPRRVEAVTSLQGSELEIVIRDSGPGLPGDAERLFQPFVTHRPGGLGMGLTISRTIAEAHGGHLWGETGDDGAVFTLRLPL